MRLAAFFGNFRKSGTIPDRLHDRLYPRYYSILITVTIVYRYAFRRLYLHTLQGFSSGFDPGTVLLLGQ